MKIHRLGLILALAALFSIADQLVAQNPLIRDQFTADPSARVFNGKVYVYPSHDILANEDRGRIGWFCMEDYHVFSSSNLNDWTDHGVIVSQDKVDWVNADSYSMWAPDCIERNGKYYFYFPAFHKDTSRLGRGFSIGVAVADQPEGPYIPQPEPIKGFTGIDPNAFIDKDGQAYLYWSLGEIFVAKLKENMLELDSEIKVVEYLPDSGLKEGPYVFERQGIYYMTYPHVENRTERLEYAIGDNPMGPFRFAGVIMDESPSGCWTNHHSIVEFEGQWYLFYHHNDYSPKFDKARSIRVDSLFFKEDGTIQKVRPTLRGVGVSEASRQIQLDRYSLKSDAGATVALLDTLHTFKGWKAILNEENAWIRYNKLDFGDAHLPNLELAYSSQSGGTLHIRLDSAGGPLLAELKVAESKDWKTILCPLSEIPSGIHDLVVVSKSQDPVEIDWIRFTK